MALSPWYVGQTKPTWDITWAGVDLTGATVTVRIGLLGGAAALGGGVLTQVNARSGHFTYAPIAGDFAAAGTYVVQFKCVYGDGTLTFSDPVTVTVLAPT